MTFSEGMQIDTSTTSSSGGGPGRGIAIGGGLGGLVLVVVALLLGVDPGTIPMEPQPGQQQEVSGFDISQCKTGADANKILGCRIIATGNSVDAVWTQRLAASTRGHRSAFSGPGQNRVRQCDHGSRPVLLPRRPDRVLRHRLLRRASRPTRVQRAGRSPRSTSSPTSSATTCRTCSATSGAHSNPALRGLRVPACARSCRPTATPAYGPTTRRCLSRAAPRILEPLTDKDIQDVMSATSPWATTGSRSGPPAASIQIPSRTARLRSGSTGSPSDTSSVTPSAATRSTRRISARSVGQ